MVRHTQYMIPFFLGLENPRSTHSVWGKSWDINGLLYKRKISISHGLRIWGILTKKPTVGNFIE